MKLCLESLVNGRCGKPWTHVERFVRGWKASAEKVFALVGAKQLSADAVVDSPMNAKCREDVFMTVGNGSVTKGENVARQAVAAILGDTLVPAQWQIYARVCELVLNHVARPLATQYVDEARKPLDQILMQSSYAVPNDSHARWTPILEKLGMSHLAAAWGAPTFTFPWRADGPDLGKWPWPIWTIIEAAHCLRSPTS